MSSFKEIRRKTWLKFSLIYSVVFVLSNFFPHTSAVPNGPRLVGIIPPPQVLLPPHREEGQSLDDIIYGTSFSGGSLFPSSLTSLPPTTTTPRPTRNSFQSFNQDNNINRARSNTNLVQTFLPPSPAFPSSSTSRTTIITSTTSRPFSVSPNSIFATSSRPSPFFSASGEEIKVPQTLKLRSPHRKQYTKADLIAAANSLKPAGFDFNKLLLVSPTNFNNVSREKASNVYQNARFPLPLFDTPVFNEIRPLMEMIMKQKQLQQQQQQAKFNGRSSEGESDNKKVLVIIPKRSSGTSSTARSTSRSGNSIPTNTGNRQAKQLSSPSHFSTQDKAPSTSNFVVIPKTTKSVPTVKPKSFHSSTTKRTVSSKLVEISKKTEKNPDLQVAATSNKLSQQKTSGKNPSSGNDSVKRSYSIKGPDNYSFSYEVKNNAYGDVKSHSESRDGDQVAGEYSMLEADGYTRVVRYTVDSDQGFKASVKRIPPS